MRSTARREGDTYILNGQKQTAKSKGVIIFFHVVSL